MTNELRQRIKERRQALGITQKELADRVGVSRPMIAMIESGEREPSLDTLVRILSALGLLLEVKTIDSKGDSHA